MYHELTIQDIQTLANGGTSKDFFGSTFDSYGAFAGTLEGEMPYQLISVEVALVHGGDVDEAQAIDFQSVCESSELSVTIGGDLVVRGPAGCFPSGGARVQATLDNIAAPDTICTATNGGGSRLLARYPVVGPRQIVQANLKNPSDTDVAGNTKVAVRLRFVPFISG